MLYLETDLERADLDCEVSWDYAMASGVPLVIGNAYTDRFNLLCVQGDQRRMLEHARDQYEWSAGVGDRCSRAAMLAKRAARRGGPVEAEGIVRVGLAGTGRPRTRRASGSARACSRRVGARTRRRSVTCCVPARSGPPSRSGQRSWRDRPWPRRCSAQDDPAAAFELVERVLPVNSVDPRVVDELMVWGARAAADLVQRASDDRDQTAVQTHREGLARLVKTRAALPGVAFQPSGPDDTVQEAQAALFAAEQGRADGVEDQVGLWRDAVAVCADAALAGNSRSRRGGSPRRWSSLAVPSQRQQSRPRGPRLRRPAERRPAADPRRRARPPAHASHSLRQGSPPQPPSPPRSPG